MSGAAKAHYDCIKAFSETGFTDDLKAILEAIEDLAEVGVGNALIVVDDLDGDARPVGMAAHRDAAAALREFHRVADQVAQNGLQHGVVRAHRCCEASSTMHDETM